MTITPSPIRAEPAAFSAAIFPPFCGTPRGLFLFWWLVWLRKGLSSTVWPAVGGQQHHHYANIPGVTEDKQDPSEWRHAGSGAPNTKQMNLTLKEYFSVASKKAASDEISMTSNKYNDGSFLAPMTTWCSQLLFQRLVMYQEMPLAKCSDSQNSIWKENKGTRWVPSSCFSCNCPSQAANWSFFKSSLSTGMSLFSLLKL